MPNRLIRIHTAVEIDLFIDNPDQLECPSQADFEHWLTQTLIAVDTQDYYELSIRIVSLEESKQLNSQYRGKDKPTNVLSFPADVVSPEPIPLLGDLAICAGIVELEAKQQNKASDAHWAHMVVHGTLHLLGFDHIEDEEADEMEALETQIMQKMGFPAPYEH